MLPSYSPVNQSLVNLHSLKKLVLQDSLKVIVFSFCVNLQHYHITKISFFTSFTTS